MKFLDCFCGMGGVSEGFFMEGFECTGIDIIDVGYPYTLILKDMRELDGNNFRDFDVIWGSPPCRDFSPIGCAIGHRWKRPPDPNYGLQFVNAYIKFIENAKPKIWIMENVDRMRQFYKPKARVVKAIIKGNKRHAFWGNFPNFLIPQGDPHSFLATGLRPHGKRAGQYLKTSGYDRKTISWLNAKIPLACSLAFARAIKEELNKK